MVGKDSSVKGLVAAFQKTYGETIANYGGNFTDEERIPTGIFPLDLTLGGGFPRSRVTIIYGKESSNKTNIALLAIASHQRMWPKQTCAFIDVEHAFDPAWATILGVDTAKLVVVAPSFAEQVIDMVEGILQADDIGLVVIDSLAAMITTQEADADASNNRPGGSSLIIGKLVRKILLSVDQANKNGVFPTVIYINQIRQAIGVMHGDPDKMPGGNAPVFQASLILKCYGKNIIDKAIHKVMPSFKDVSVTVKKFKVPIMSMHCKFEMILIPHKHFKIGDTKDWTVIQSYLEVLGQFEKLPKGGYKMLDNEYATIKLAEETIYSDREYGAEVRKALIEEMVNNNELLIQEDDK